MGLFDGLLGGGGGSADDPYADILTPAQRNQMQVQGLLAMAGAFAQAGMPSRLPVPFGSALGSAAAALGTGQEAGMKTAIENALAAQKVRDLRNMAEYRKKVLGDIDPTSPLGRAIDAINNPGGTAPTPGPTPAGVVPPAGTSAGPGASPAAPAAGGPLTMELPYAPGGGGGLLGPGDGGAEGEYGGGQKVGGLLGPGPAATAAPAPSQAALSQDAAAAEVARMDAEYAARNPRADAAARAAVHTENVIAANRPGSGSSSGAPAEPPTSAGGDTPWGPTFAQQAAARIRGAPTPEMTDAIVKAAADNNLPPQIMHGLLGVESNFNPSAVSPTGAKGIAQFISSTARSMNLADPFDPQQAIPKSAEYLAKLRDQYGGDLNKALMAYNAGGNQSKWNPGYAAAVNQRAGEFVPPDGSGGGEDAGWGPTFAQGGPDRVIPSGAGNNLPITRAQYAPGAGGAPMPGGPAAGGLLGPPPAGGVLAPPSGGGLLAPPGADPAKYNALLLELARQNAAAEVLGMGNPFGSLLSVLQGSPQYKQQITGAEEAAREPYRQIARDQELKNALTKEGWQIDANGNAVPVPLYNDVAAAKANAISTATEGPKLDSALAQQNKMRVYDAQGHVMIVPITGGAEADARAKGLTATAEEAAKAQTDIGTYTVLGPDGRTNYTVQMPRSEALQRMRSQGGDPRPGDIVGTQQFNPRQTEIATGSAKLDLAEATKYRQEGDDALEARTATNLLLRNPQIDWQGPLAAPRQAFNRATASVLGLNTESVKSYEFASQLMGDALRKALRASDPNPTERQQVMMQASFPMPATSREGYEQGLRYMAGVQDWKIYRGEQLRGHMNANNNDPAGFRVSMSAIPFVVMRMNPADQAAYMETLGRADHTAVSRLADQMEQIRRTMPNSQF